MPEKTKALLLPDSAMTRKLTPPCLRPVPVGASCPLFSHVVQQRYARAFGGNNRRVTTTRVSTAVFPKQQCLLLRVGARDQEVSYASLQVVPQRARAEKRRVTRRRHSLPDDASRAPKTRRKTLTQCPSKQGRGQDRMNGTSPLTMRNVD